MEKENISVPVGRFAPSPSGRMHLGNLFTALLSWLSVRSRGGRWILRIEDLDPQRSKYEFARRIEDDLRWLGLDWDEGGTEGTGPDAPYMQSRRHELYAGALAKLQESGLVYPCYCTRADILATQAPHASDGRVVYGGTCRPAGFPCVRPVYSGERRAALRIYVPDSDISFEDRIFGRRIVNLGRQCGDFVLRRADGAWAYQLAVVVDDALMGITEVVRGCDLIDSTAQQIYLYRLLGYGIPEFCHVPLLCGESGLRLSKRDSSLSMESLRRDYTPEDIIGRIAYIAGLLPKPTRIAASELAAVFDWKKIPPQCCITV